MKTHTVCLGPREEKDAEAVCRLSLTCRPAVLNEFISLRRATLSFNGNETVFRLIFTFYLSLNVLPAFVVLLFPHAGRAGD